MPGTRVNAPKYCVIAGQPAGGKGLEIPFGIRYNEVKGANHGVWAVCSAVQLQLFQLAHQTILAGREILRWRVSGAFAAGPQLIIVI